MTTDSRLSALPDTLELVTKDGPLALWRKQGTQLYTTTCGDCQAAVPFTHRADAEDWMDLHDCVGTW